MKLETDYPFVWQLVGGDLGVDDGWMDEKLTGKTPGGQVWTGDLRSIALYYRQSRGPELRTSGMSWS